MKILIIGSEGFLGIDLQKTLKKKFKLKIFNFIKKKKKLNNYLNIDLTKNVNLKRLKNDNYDAALLLAFYKSQPSQFNKTDKKKFLTKNKAILKNSLKICKILNIKKIIYFSSAAVYSNNLDEKKIKETFLKKPSNIYGKFKIYAEKQIISFGMKNKKNAINLRLFNYFNSTGNVLISNLRKQLRNKVVNINGNGNQKRDFLHINDISKVIEKIIYKNINSGNYNLCSGNSIKMNTILNQLNLKNKKIINYNSKIRTNYNLVGNNFKLKKQIKWRINNNFNKFISTL